MSNQTITKNTNYRGAAHPMSDEIRRQAQARMKKLPKRGRFGDARDAYIVADTKARESMGHPCTSKGFSTMPRRKAG
jgi:hypothetical protein